MNNVLDHAGWRFFQSSFRIENGTEYSTFQVAKDPGIETIYLGSIVMVLGIGIMFWGLPGTREKMSVRRRIVHISLSILFTLLVVLFVQNSSKSTPGHLDFSALKTLPILLEGRVVPFDTYARKFSYTVTGSQRPFKKNSIEFVMDFVKNENPLAENVIKIDNHAIKERLKIEKTDKYTHPLNT